MSPPGVIVTTFQKEFLRIAKGLWGTHRAAYLNAPIRSGRTWACDFAARRLTREAQKKAPARRLQALHVEFHGSETPINAVRHISRTMMGATSAIDNLGSESQAFDFLSDNLAFRGVRLLIVDNAHWLPSESLRFIARQCKCRSLAACELLPKNVKLGILFVGDRIDSEIHTEIARVCDLEGVLDAVDMTFNECVAVLARTDDRFLSVISNARKKPKGKDFNCLVKLYETAKAQLPYALRIVESLQQESRERETFSADDIRKSVTAYGSRLRPIPATAFRHSRDTEFDAELVQGMDPAEEANQPSIAAEV